MASTDCGIKLESYFHKVGINGIGYTFTSESIKFPYDYEKINIVSPEIKALNPKENKDIYFFEPHYLGNEKYSLSFLIESKASINFYCVEEEYEALPYMVRKILSKELTENSKNLYISGILDVEFHGVVTISNIADNLTIEQLKVHFSYLGSEASELLCTLDIEGVEIKEVL